MYVGVMTAVLSEAAFFGSLRILEYALVIWGMVFLFVLAYEEPTLRKKFGASYEAYCRAALDSPPHSLVGQILRSADWKMNLIRRYSAPTFSSLAPVSSAISACSELPWESIVTMAGKFLASSTHMASGIPSSSSK